MERGIEREASECIQLEERAKTSGSEASSGDR